jgi:hypothetical protein
MLPVPASKIAKTDVQSLLDNQTPESRTLDYKRDLSLNTSEEKREFAKDVSALANSDGGFLLYGIEEEGGLPRSVLGTACPDFDALQLRAESVLRDHVQPRIAGVSFGKVEGYSNGAVVVIYVPRSWTGPHMVGTPNQSLFFSRSNSGKFPMDVQQIRSAFIAGTHVAQRIQDFRTERIGRILANQGGMPLSNEPKLIVHVHPLSDAPGVFTAVAGDDAALPPLSGSGYSYSSRFNLDGFLTHPAPGNGSLEVYCYSMVFRNGAFERCEPVYVDNKKQPPIAFGIRLESDISKAVARFVALSRRHGERGPLAILVSLTGMNGIRIGATNRSVRAWEAHFSVDRNVLALPELLWEADTIAPDDLQPVFDALWQTSGFERSPSFKDGKWQEPG